MPRNRRFLLVLLLLSLLLPALSVHSFGSDTPVLSPAVRDTAGQSALSITMYLTDALHLTQAQATAVRRHTQTELQALALAATPAAKTQAEQQYEAALAQLLSGEQYRQFLLLEHSGPVAAATARVLAVR